MSLADFTSAAALRIKQGAYACAGAPLRSHGSLVAALQREAAIIAEIKPASPSQGRLLDRPAGEVLDAYRRGQAAAISALTDSDFFAGSLGLLRQAHTTGLPTMMKDFVVDEAQIEAAAHHGASAVLLIERILEPARREDLVATAHARGLEVLLEVFDRHDWETAAASEADAFGVNARDLDTLRVDRDAQRSLLADVAASGRPTVALSGINTRQDRLAAHQAGADAVLVGTSLMRQRDPALALRGLRRPLAKVCGITGSDELADAVAAGADLIGLVVASPGSPRDIDVARAARLAAQAWAGGVPPVLVTACPEAAHVVAAAEAVRPLAVQWHSAPADAGPRLHAVGIGFWPAVTPAGRVPDDADGFVVDSAATGGTGKTHDWHVAHALFAHHATPIGLVAGGLDRANAAAAIAATGAWGADASSQLESSPGVKDAGRVAAFVQAVHDAA